MVNSFRGMFHFVVQFQMLLSVELVVWKDSCLQNNLLCVEWNLKLSLLLLLLRQLLCVDKLQSEDPFGIGSFNAPLQPAGGGTKPPRPRSPGPGRPKSPSPAVGGQSKSPVPPGRPKSPAPGRPKSPAPSKTKSSVPPPRPAAPPSKSPTSFRTNVSDFPSRVSLGLLIITLIYSEYLIIRRIGFDVLLTCPVTL